MGAIREWADGWKSWYDEWGEHMFFFAILLYDQAAYFMVQPAFGIVLQEKLHPTNFELGAFTSVFGMTMAIAQLYYGYLSDYLGRVPVLAVSIFCGACSWVFTAWAATPMQMIWARAFCGVTTGTMTLLNAIILDLTPPDKTATANQYVSSCTGMGLAVGPAVGGLLIGSIGFENTCYLSACGLFVSSALMCAKWQKKMPDVLKKGGSGKEQGSQQNPIILTCRLLIKQPLTIMNLFALFVNIGSVTVYAAFFPLAAHLVNGFTPLTYGILVSLSASVLMWGTSIVPYVVNLQSTRGLACAFRISQVIQGCGFLVFCIQFFTGPLSYVVLGIDIGSMFLTFITLSLFFIGMFTGGALINTLIVENAHPDALGTLMGIFWFVRQLGECVWPIVVGPLTELPIFKGSPEALNNGMYMMLVSCGVLAWSSCFFTCQTARQDWSSVKEPLLC